MWRRAVASSSPPPPLGSTARPPYLHRGHNVLVRLLVDAPALPLPLMSDPLLVRWFGAHAPLWAGDGAADAAAFAPPPTERRRLEHAAALLRAEARQYALVVSDGRQAAPSPESEELQLLLYGTASFGESLAVLELLHATTVVQVTGRHCHCHNRHACHLHLPPLTSSTPPPSCRTSGGATSRTSTSPPVGSRTPPPNLRRRSHNLTRRRRRRGRSRSEAPSSPPPAAGSPNE